MIPPDGRVIGSIGCGKGATEAALIGQGREVHGVDIAPEAIEVAKSRLTSARLIAPEDHRPFAPASLDGLILADVLEHLPRAWEALARYAEAVRPGGWVAISVPNMRYLDAVWQLVVRGDWPEECAGIFDASHVQVMTHRRLQRWCRQAGLEIAQWFDRGCPSWRRHRWRRLADRLTLRLFHSWFQFQIQVLCRKTTPPAGAEVPGTCEKERFPARSAAVTRPLVSIIMAACNGERYLREALDSALSQTHRPIEVIVVNDGSTDGTAGILADYGDRIRVCAQPNAGQASARNHAVAVARGQWLALLDQDDLWDPTKLAVQLEAVHGDQSVVFSNARIVDGAGHVTVDRAATARGSDATTLHDLIVSNRILALTALVRRNVVQEVGGFDDKNRFGTDDYQLWLRLAAAGNRFLQLDQVLASYRIHGGNMSLGMRRMLLGDMYALETVRREYPKAFRAAERKAYHARLNELHFGIGWHLYHEGNYAEAAGHFGQAVRHSPGQWRSWMYAVVTRLPLRRLIVPRLRQWLRGKVGPA